MAGASIRPLQQTDSSQKFGTLTATAVRVPLWQSSSRRSHSVLTANATTLLLRKNIGGR